MTVLPKTLFFWCKAILAVGKEKAASGDDMITVWEHFFLFVVLSLLVSLVYSGLRQEDLKSIVRLALKRFVVFMGASVVFGIAVYFIARGL